MPFFIDWLECPHPADTNPVGGEFIELSLTLPDPAPLQEVLSGLSLKVEVTAGEPGLSLSIETRSGTVELASTDETRDLGFG